MPRQQRGPGQPSHLGKEALPRHGTARNGAQPRLPVKAWQPIRPHRMAWRAIIAQVEQTECFIPSK